MNLVGCCSGCWYVAMLKYCYCGYLLTKPIAAGLNMTEPGSTGIGGGTGVYESIGRRYYAGFSVKF